MAGVGLDTKIYPSDRYDQVTFSPDQGGAASSSMPDYRKYQQERFYDVQTSLTLEEARYSEMRKKIPGLGRIPKDRFHEQDPDSEFQKRKKEHITFVKQHFRQIECSKFVPKPNQTSVKKIRDLKCHCGEVLSEHAGLSNTQPMNSVQRDIVEAYLIPDSKLRSIINRETLFKAPPNNIPVIPWSKEEAFRENICTTFGKISFVNNDNQLGGSKPAKYVRLSHKDSVDKCLELMEKHWKIMEPKPPSLCISVIGGAKSFKLDNKMRETFNTGLIKAAKTTNAWLITTGSNVGVMKAVGNAVSEGQSFLWDNDRITHTLRLIGIGPWGYVKDRKMLESDGNGRFPVHFQTSNVIIHGKPVPLNPNHTHFVFVDDGVRNTYTGASEFRAQFEQKVSKPTEAGGLGIPVVLVILEGGTDAIHDAMVTLAHKIPVVVCSGTGRAADILAYAYSHTRSNKGELKPKHEEKLKEKIFDAYGERWKEKDIEENLEKHLRNVKKCMEHRDLINIFPMNKHEDLDIAILTALLNSKAGEASDKIRQNQLKLALTWDRDDIAQEEIFREDVLWPSGSLDDVLMEAILEERVEFVALILQQNVVMKEFLTTERLQTLYEMSLARTDSIHLRKLMDRTIHTRTFTYDNLARLMESLMDKYDHNIEEDNVDDTNGVKFIPVKKKGQRQFKWPYKQLMIWSILMLRQKLAKFAWQMGSEPVTSAVAASRIYGSMAEHIHRNESALKERIIEYKDEFEHLAKSVLDECHVKHQEKAMMLAERKSPTWSSMTSLQIAASAVNRAFLSSVACKNSIDNNWNRGIQVKPIKVLVTVFFPFLLFSPFLEVNTMGEKTAKTSQKILTFYTAPITKFTHYSILYMFFVALFTYYLLVDYQFYCITCIEIVCMVWIITFIVDELYTLLTFPSPTFHGKIRDWYGILKTVDMLNLLLALVVFIIKVACKETYAYEAKVILSMNCIIFYLRIMKLYTPNNSLGPKLVMIKMMFEELCMFLLLVVVFLFAYGVASQSLLYRQREASCTWDILIILKDIVFYPYWELYGELEFDESTATNHTCIRKASQLNPERSRVVELAKCKKDYWLVYILCAGYLLMGNVLLFNLLIAIFNNIYKKVEQRSNEIWKFQMYFLTMEFDNKTALVPPLSIIPHLYLCFKWLARKTCCKKKSMGVQFTQRHLEFLQLFEKEEMANYLRRIKSEHRDSTESKLQKRVEELFKLVEEELTADHGGSSLNQTLSATQTVKMARETTLESCPLEPSGWPRTEAVLDYAKNLEEKEEQKTKGEAKEDVVDEDQVKKEKKKKHKKDKKKKKQQEEEKIINLDQQNNAKPESEAWKDMASLASNLSPRLTKSPIRGGPDSTPKNLFLQRHQTTQINLSDDSFDSDDVQPQVPDSSNILSMPRRTGSNIQASDSDSDMPRRLRSKKSLLRVESSTEDERRSKKRIFNRRRSRQLSESD
ncbi:transient receptor potential cation channel subfamily M member-like 2 [Saccostrea echinata]|uniref:transient receptor potential cation channel subfamily M member-like 2 n=1 Tax=Saccostrea echinata TaxID=191078 RepID=UPI002A8080EE|nr:transient receptor potential cation channel subfamily M member-like 2 [Saccostrea echinata]